VLQKAKAQCEETESINQHTCNAEAESICCSFKTQGSPDVNPEQAQTSRIACREARGKYNLLNLYMQRAQKVFYCGSEHCCAGNMMFH